MHTDPDAQASNKPRLGFGYFPASNESLQAVFFTKSTERPCEYRRRGLNIKIVAALLHTAVRVCRLTEEGAGEREFPRSCLWVSLPLIRHRMDGQPGNTVLHSSPGERPRYVAPGKRVLPRGTYCVACGVATILHTTRGPNHPWSLAPARKPRSSRNRGGLATPYTPIRSLACPRHMPAVLAPAPGA